MTARTDRNLKQPGSRRRVRACVDEAEQTFLRCWQTLVAMKDLVKLEGNAILTFQPNLATALFKLDDAYRKLIQSRKALIQNKTSHSATWFVRRMRSLDKNLKGLRAAIDVGRSLGDAFAWAFYRQDQPLLEQHFKQPLNPHTPPGIGGRGELEFIRQARPAGFFMLYHGITTFLRIGDVSFYDLEARRISSIGELKSTPIEPGHLTVRVHLVGQIGNKIPFADSSRKIHINESPPAGRASNAAFEERLKKQLNRAAEVARSEGTIKKADLMDAYHMEQLSLFAKQLSASGLAYQQLGKGLLLAGTAAYRGKSLSSRIFSNTSEKSVLKRMRRITEHVIGIADAGLPDNSIHLSELDNCVRLGWPPLFWFPCDTPFLEALYFLCLVVSTVYNPAHLFKQLRELGYEVVAQQTKNGTPTFEVTKKGPQGVLKIEHFDFFLRLIQQRFMREERIVQMLENAQSEIPQLGSADAARIQFGFVHLF
jgi:hypothetical protein